MTLQDPVMLALFSLIIISVVAAFGRLMVGPSVPDRVVAVDLIATKTIGIITFMSIVTDEPALLNVAAVIALTAFLSTIALAYYIEQRRWR
ncbi:MAG: monovalent cation/H+ antiporter complex subunit F [Anaerolineales bacterium]